MRSSTRWALVLGTLLAGLLLPPVTRAEDPASPSPATEAPTRERDDGRRTLRHFPANLARGAAGLFHGGNLVPFLVGGTATASASFLDDEVVEAVADPRTVVRVNGGPGGEARSPQLGLSPILGHKTRAVFVTVRF